MLEAPVDSLSDEDFDFDFDLADSDDFTCILTNNTLGFRSHMSRFTLGTHGYSAA